MGAATRISPNSPQIGAGGYSPRVLAGVTIGGSISYYGQIFSDEDMGAVKVARDVHNLIDSGGRLASVTIGGSIFRESGPSGSTGPRSMDDMGPVKVGGSVLGGSIISSGRLGNVSIGGSLMPTADGVGGFVSAEGHLGTVRIGGEAASEDSAPPPRPILPSAGSLVPRVGPSARRLAKRSLRAHRTSR